MDDWAGGGIEMIAVSALRAHPGNSNVMGEEMLGKLAAHIGRSGRYPPLIVRPLDASGGRTFEVLDGHHRLRVLERLRHERAACVVWDVDDDEALVLMATLNRLEGRDDPLRRAALMRGLRDRLGKAAGEIARLVPESATDVRRYLEVSRRAPVASPARAIDEMPASVHFFLTGGERAELEGVLDGIGGRREEALMRLVRERAGGGCEAGVS